LVDANVAQNLRLRVGAEALGVKGRTHRYQEYEKREA
jgi:hypothetical protein